ncbi:MAG: hypothetical protein COA97_13060 [Flavobacteriales bacterium]|nr:MAG: hypothetical protein COA97_13060 [Flavobacteriales bacterium]
MQRKFITNLALLLVLNFLIKPFWIFGIDLEVHNLFVESYGTYFALFGFSMLFNICLDFGITTFNSRNIAQNHQQLTKYFSGIVVFKLLLAMLYFLISMGVGLLVGFNAEEFYMLFFLSINQFLISFIQYLRSNVAGLQLFTLDSLLSVLDKFLMIIFCSILLWSNLFKIKFELIHFVYAQTAAYGLTVFIVFLIVAAKSGQYRFNINKSFLLLILKQTYPYALLVLMMTFYYRLDGIMLKQMLPDGELQASIYAQAYRLMDASTQVGVLFAALLLPMFANMIKNNKKVDELVRLSFSLLFVPALVIAFFSYSFSQEIMAILYHANIAAAASVFKILMLCFAAIGITYILGTLLTANGSLKVLNMMALSGMILNFVLNIILIPTFKAEGSAYASLATQVLIVLAQILVAYRVFKFNINWKFLASLGVYIIAIYMLTLGVKIYVSEFYLQFILFILVSAILAVLLRVINLKKMYHILINREF